MRSAFISSSSRRPSSWLRLHRGVFLAVSFGALALVADRRPLLAGLLAVVAVLTRPSGSRWRCRSGSASSRPSCNGAVRRICGHGAARRSRRVGRRGGGAGRGIPRVVVVGAGQDVRARPARVLRPGTAEPGGRVGRLGTGDLGFGDALPETRVYYGLEVAAVVLAVVACAWAARRWPGPALFGLAVLVISLRAASPRG